MENIARYLLEIKAVQLSPTKPFIWTSGMKSPIYCDNRKLLSYPFIRSSVIEGLKLQTKQFEAFDLIAGVVTAGLPHASIMSDQMGLPLIYVRSKEKSHGLHNRIEGVYQTGQRVLLIEDLISTAGSCIEAAQACREAGLIVVGVLAIFTYNLPISRERFESSNIKWSTLTHFEELILKAKEMDVINHSDLDLLKSWNANPQAYSERIEIRDNGN